MSFAADKSINIADRVDVLLVSTSSLAVLNCACYGFSLRHNHSSKLGNASLVRQGRCYRNLLGSGRAPEFLSVFVVFGCFPEVSGRLSYPPHGPMLRSAFLWLCFCRHKPWPQCALECHLAETVRSILAQILSLSDLGPGTNIW